MIVSVILVDLHSDLYNNNTICVNDNVLINMNEMDELTHRTIEPVFLSLNSNYLNHCRRKMAANSNNHLHYYFQSYYFSLLCTMMSAVEERASFEADKDCVNASYG